MEVVQTKVAAAMEELVVWLAVPVYALWTSSDTIRSATTSSFVRLAVPVAAAVAVAVAFAIIQAAAVAAAVAVVSVAVRVATMEFAAQSIVLQPQGCTDIAASTTSARTVLEVRVVHPVDSLVLRLVVVGGEQAELRQALLRLLGRRPSALRRQNRPPG
jgi:hypothetical protein